jgi:hypothetical protein
MRHERLLTAAAAAVLAKDDSKLREDGRFRLIELDAKSLQKIAGRLSTDVLAMAAAAR